MKPPDDDTGRGRGRASFASDSTAFSASCLRQPVLIHACMCLFDWASSHDPLAVCRGSHWGCDGTLVVVGAGNKTAQLNVLTGSERPGVAAAQMSTSDGGPQSSEEESSVVSCLPQEFLRVSSAERSE